MPSVRDVVDALELVAPSRLKFPWDRIGLQVGDPNADVTRAAVSLDRSMGAVRFAAEQSCELLIAHHPLIFSPIETVTSHTLEGRTILELARNEIAFIAAHTNWDAARGGVNDALLAKLALKAAGDFGSGASDSPYLMVVYAPHAETDRIVDAAARAGAGTIDPYHRCAYLSEGHGTFEPTADAQPAIGSVGNREVVAEARIEMIVQGDDRGRVEAAVRAAHPYESPVIAMLPLSAHPLQPAGRLGHLVESMTLAAFGQHVRRCLGDAVYAWGDPGKSVRCVAVCGGAADGEWRAAMNAGADVLVTGEVKQHVAVEAYDSGFAIVAAGHYATEQPGVLQLAITLREKLASIDWLVYEPEAGASGRPKTW